jgi:hypothetical protein
MDSGAMDYESLWLTSSLRGICIVDMKIEAGREGYHSGETGGIIPETFRIARSLLNRLDDPDTGLVTKELQVEVPEHKRAEAKNIVELYGEKIYTKYKMHEGVQAMD